MYIVQVGINFMPGQSYGLYRNETLLPQDLDSTNKMLHKQTIQFFLIMIEFIVTLSKKKIKFFLALALES